MTLFPSLRTLRISGCHELIEWIEAPAMPTGKIVVFPCLDELYIWSCKRWRIAPSHFPSLQKLEVREVKEAMPIEDISSELPSLTSFSIDCIYEFTCLPKWMLRNNTNLTYLEITNCVDLTFIAHNLFGCCTSLWSLVVKSCWKLRHLPDGLDTLPLEKLTIGECPSLEFIPITHGIASLRELKINYCPELSGLPSRLEYCSSLQVLSISICRKLTPIPISYGLACLLELRIEYCDGLSGILSELEYCVSLQELGIWSCSNLISIQIAHGMALTSLQVLRIGICDELTSLPVLELCPSLRQLTIMRCRKLTSISVTLSDQTSLKKLDIQSCNSLQAIPALHIFTSLRRLWIVYREGLESLVSGLQIPVSLEELVITGFPNVGTVPSLESLTSLHQLWISECGKLKRLPTGFHCLTRLKSLTIGAFCKELDTFPDFPVFSQLERLTLMGWPKLKSLPQEVQQFISSTYLKIQSFDGVEALPEWLGNLSSLTLLNSLVREFDVPAYNQGYARPHQLRNHKISRMSPSTGRMHQPHKP